MIARPLTDLPLTQIAYSVLLSRRLENARAEDLLMRAFLPAVPLAFFFHIKHHIKISISLMARLEVILESAQN